MSTAAKDKKNVAKGFQPLGDRLFVTYTEELERTAGGIYVPDSAKEKPQRGIVQAVGKKVENVKVGDHVVGPLIHFLHDLIEGQSHGRTVGGKRREFNLRRLR